MRSVVLSELNICKSQISDLSTQISTAKIMVKFNPEIINSNIKKSRLLSQETDNANDLEVKNRQLQIKCEKLEREVKVLKEKLE